MVRAILLALIAAPALAVRRRYPSGMNVPLTKLVALDDEVDLDLPCPWCRGATSEFDDSCASCGKRFGV